MAGMTQVQLAEKLGCGQAHISNWESGRYVPRGDMLEKLIVVFGLPLDFFFDLDTEKMKCYQEKESKNG